MKNDPIKLREIQQQRKQDLDELLRMFEQSGFQTNKGSNTHTLASIVVDFVNKSISKRKHDLSILSLWDSQDMNVIVPMMFDRYRIYNERHQPKLYSVEGFENLKEYEQISGYNRLVFLGDNTAAYALAKRITISRLDNEQPTKLGVQYGDLYTGSLLKSGELEFFESYTSETGVYQERDFVILPDEKGQAWFYPITDFKTQTNKVLELNLLVKHQQGKPYELPLLKDEVIITPDLLRFVLTQLMSKFPTYRGMTVEEFKLFVKLKFGLEMIEGNHTLVIEQTPNISDIQSFAYRNIFGKWIIEEASQHRVQVHIEDDRINLKLQDYLEDKFETFEKIESLREKTFHLVDMFYAVTFGLDANFVKSQHPAKIDIVQLQGNSLEYTQVVL